MLYLTAIILSFFLSFLLFTKKGKNQADYLLATWLAVIGCHMSAFYLLFTGQLERSPTLAAIGLSLPLAHGPFLYLYTYRQTSVTNLYARQFLHFLPLLISLLVFSPFHFLNEQEQLEVFANKGGQFKLRSIINLYIVYFSGIVYVSLSIHKLIQYRKKIIHQFSNIEKINFNWLLYLLVWMACIWIVVLYIGGDRLIFAVISLFVLWLGYFGLRQVQVFGESHLYLEEPAPPYQRAIAGSMLSPEKAPLNYQDAFETPVKYQKSTLSEVDLTRIHKRLKQLLDEDQPYKNPDLTLNELAKTLEVHPNHLSQVINSQENKSFYDLINEKRVEEFIRLAEDPSNQQFTLLALAFDCGFNSKASFNRNFKKYRGVTPSDFLKVQEIK